MTASAESLAPEALEFDDRGNPYSGRYGDVYASRDGAWGQALHVFLAGNGLPQRWCGRRAFVVLETGFGLGTNFLATWTAWRDDPGRPQRLDFVSIEKHPLRAQDLLAAPAGAREHPDAPVLRAQLSAQWPLPLAGLHRLEFEDGRVVLTLALGDARALAQKLHAGVDAFYLDGFAPDRNPQMWEPPLIRALSRLARADATAASYTCARGVRDALSGAGFVVERAPGYGGKREMLRARFAPRWTARRHEPRATYGGPREAIVVGAGLAGCSTAHALRRRGWRVALVDRAGAPASGASALPVGILQPLLSADDNLASRLTRAGARYSRQVLQRVAPAGGADRMWAPCGVFHQAVDEREDALWRARLAEQAWPEAFVRYCSARDAHSLLGLLPRYGGAWFEQGAIVSASRWCHALSASGRGGEPAWGAWAVARLEPRGGGWRIVDGAGRSIEAPVVVVAGGIEAAPLLGLNYAPLHAIGGQISLLAAPALRELRAAVSGAGFLVPPLLGQAAVGATYEELPAGAAAPPPGGTFRAHERNLARLVQLLAHAPAVEARAAFSGVRCATRDRMPLAGPVADEAGALAAALRLRGAHLVDVPRLPGLHCLAALGSRGLALAPLLAEHVAATICGEPAPIEAELSAAVDPARFLLRRLRGAACAAQPMG